MKEYIKLREENDELELNILEMEMKKTTTCFKS